MVRKLRLAVNAMSLLSAAGGIGQYTRHLFSAMLAHEDVEACFFYGSSWSPRLREHAIDGIDRVKTIIKKVVPNAYAIRQWYCNRRFAARTRWQHFDLYHEPAFLPQRFEGPTVITVHDLSHMRYPETHPGARVAHLNKELPRAIAESNAVITDSDYVRREVINIFGSPSRNVHTIPLGVSPVFQPIPASESVRVLRSYGLEHKRYVLVVGTLEPRKNLVSALQAYAGLPMSLQRDFPFVVVGGRGWLVGEISKALEAVSCKNRIRMLGYMPQVHMPALYSGATVLLYPSLYEGFGLPVLEAMACATPVIASNRAAIPETLGDAGLMVDPENIPALTAGLLELLQDVALRELYAARGVDRAGLFSWERCAASTVKVYHSVLGSSIGR